MSAVCVLTKMVILSHFFCHNIQGIESIPNSCCLVAKLCPTHCDPMDCQAPLSLGFPRQEYWSGLPFPFPGDLPDPGIEPGSPALEADALTSEPPGKSMDQLLLNCDDTGN